MVSIRLFSVQSRCCALCLLLVFQLLFLPSCGVTEEHAAVPTIESGVFSFACSGDFRPFSYIDDQQELRGFDVAVGEAIAQALGLRPQALKYKFAALIEGVNSGRFDAAVASHTVTPERRAHVLFSEPYYFSGPQIFTRSKSTIDSADDLHGKEVAVSKGSTYETIARGYTNKIRIYDSDVTALEALSAGRHDAVITDFITGQLAQRRSLNVTAKAMLGRSAQAVAVSRDNPALLQAINKALQKLRADGTLQAISLQFFDKDITEVPKGFSEVKESSEVGKTEASALSNFILTLYTSAPLFISAAIITVKLTVVSMMLGICLGLCSAFLSISSIPLSRVITSLYVYLVRGTPLIVQIFILYFGLTSIVKMSGFWAASLALAFHNGAYISEIFRGAIQSIERGQFEAARSLGMAPLTMYRKIIMPQAFLRALPSLGNQCIIGLKDSSLAAFISINELFNVATTQGANHFDQMTYLLIVALYFLVLVLGLTWLVHVFETRFSAHRIQGRV